MDPTSLSDFGVNTSVNKQQQRQITLDNEVTMIRNAPKVILAQLVQMLNDNFDLMWGINPQFAITPQHRAEKLGTDAVKVFSDHARAKAFVTELLLNAGKTPEQIAQMIHDVPDIYEYKFSEDGSVTITEKSNG